ARSPGTTTKRPSFVSAALHRRSASDAVGCATARPNGKSDPIMTRTRYTFAIYRNAELSLTASVSGLPDRITMTGNAARSGAALECRHRHVRIRFWDLTRTRFPAGENRGCRDVDFRPYSLRIPRDCERQTR